MLVILDTDVLTLLQRQSQPAYARLQQRLVRLSDADMATTVVSFQEQARGWLASLNQAPTETRLLAAYASFRNLLDAFCRLNVLPYDAMAHTQFNELRRQRIRIGTMDQRIAAIALSQGATVVTRNARDFGRVPGLKVEDWTC